VEAAASTTDFVPIHMGDDDRNGAQAVCIGSRTDAQASLQEAGNLQTADGRGQNNAAHHTASEAQHGDYARARKWAAPRSGSYVEHGVVYTRARAWHRPRSSALP
jgi:hypothetical protein